MLFLIFSACHHDPGDSAAGPVLLLDARSGTDPSFPEPLTPLGDGLLFNTYAVSESSALWFSDGTAAGTGVVGAFGWPWFPQWGAEVGGEGYFLASRDNVAVGVWQTDGTEAGTAMVEPLTSASAQAPWGVAVGDRYVYAWTDEARGGGVFATDGTHHEDVMPYALAGALFRGELVLVGGGSLWSTDGTAAGTVALGATADAVVGPTAIGDRVLWVDLGGVVHTWDGNHLADLPALPLQPERLCGAGSEALALSETSDDTLRLFELGASNAQELDPFTETVQFGYPCLGRGNEAFVASDVGLWRVASGGETRLGDLAGISAIADLDGTLALGARTPTGNAIATTDGTAAPLTRFTFDGTDFGPPSWFVPVGDHVLFDADSAAAGTELWSADAAWFAAPPSAP